MRRPFSENQYFNENPGKNKPEMRQKSKIKFSEKSRAKPKHKQKQGIYESADFSLKTSISKKTMEKRARSGANVENQGFRKIAGEAKTQAKTRYF